MADPSAEDSELLLAAALRAKAGGAGRRSSVDAGDDDAPVSTTTGQPLTLVQLILASLIGGLVVGILLAVLTLI